jgi:hypothetical protein
MKPLNSNNGWWGTGNLVHVRVGAAGGMSEVLGLGVVGNVLLGSVCTGDEDPIVLGDGGEFACWPVQPTMATAARITPAALRTRRA